MSATEKRAESASGGALSLAEDLMEGADEIAAFKYGKPKDEREAERNRRKIYHLASRGELGLFKLGGVLCGRKSTMLAKIVEREGRAA